MLARSGKEFVVPEEMTILQVIENNKAAKVECLCREGVCGTCETAILEGEADHRDQYFSDEERASQQSMLICCSRAKGKRLVWICSLPKPDVALSAPSPASEDFTADIPAINCVMLPPSAHHASRKSAPANCSAVSVSSASSAVG
ncbi:putative oxidoreductase [Escherichia coli]|uniref:Putative oxidoreductase n=1 Tax=Escherichia coli TaxID=562 RepID=A0A2X1PH43_ECOLX|nr:putative oxidoreductase [Escherichia coli]